MQAVHQESAELNELAEKFEIVYVGWESEPVK